jgi:hypothetical protein
VLADLSRRVPCGLLLGILLAVAFLLRLRGIAFGLPAINDPDELMFQMGAVRMLSHHTFNPGWFGHPATTTIYLLAMLDVMVFGFGWAVGWFATPKAFADAVYANPAWAVMPGRVAMVFFAVWSIWLVYCLTRELFDRRTALVAAAVIAINPLHIAYSQVIRSDIMALCFMQLCLLATIRFHRTRSRRALIMASLWLALAIITKWPFGLTALGMVGLTALRLREGRESVRTSFPVLASFGLCGAAFALLFSPYMVLDYPTLALNLAGEAQPHHLGATGGSVGFNLWWYLSGPFFTSFTPAGCLAVVAGMPLFWRSREGIWLLAPVVLSFVLVLSLQTLVWERWMLPLLPPLAICAALGVLALRDWLYRHASRRSAGALSALMAGTCILPPLMHFEAKARERLDDTRQVATEWARQKLPSGSVVLIEHFGFDLLPQPWTFLFPLGDVGCVDARAMLQGKIQYAAIDAGRNQRSNVDYGTLNAAKRPTCRSDYAILSQYDRYRAEQATFPREYAAYRDLLARGKIVQTIAPIPGKRGGPVVRIVQFTGAPAGTGRR